MKRVFIILAIIIVCLAGIYTVSAINGSSDSAQNETETNLTTDLKTENQELNYKKISAETAKQIMNGDNPYILLDVRTPEEFAAGHIDGAKLLPSDKIKELARTELPDKDALIIIYCQSGDRSSAVSKELIEMGYTNIHDLTGGISEWPYETVTKQETSPAEN